jgi:hypothetical protein
MKFSQMLKKWICVFLGSLFIQIFFWAIYSLLEMRIWMCGLSAVVSAMLYHFLQREEQTGLSRRNVFFAAILAPFLLAVTVTAVQLIRYPNLSLLSAALDGVSPLTETVSLYAARLSINGVLLLLFAAFDRTFLQNRQNREVIRDEHGAPAVSGRHGCDACDASDSVCVAANVSGEK